MNVIPFREEDDSGALREMASTAHIVGMIGRFISLNPGAADDHLSAYLLEELNRRKAREPGNKCDEKDALEALEFLRMEGLLTTARTAWKDVTVQKGRVKWTNY